MGTSICGVSTETPLERVSEQNLLRLWKEVGRNYEQSRLEEIKRGAAPQDAVEERYLALHGEMLRRSLLG